MTHLPTLESHGLPTLESHGLGACIHEEVAVLGRGNVLWNASVSMIWYGDFFSIALGVTM